MLNVNQITSQLARLPDPALQKYAQMHKDDPYIMALAMSEFNRRKQTRQGAQINAPEQPKVVDQAIQSMGAPMPEDVGIGQLPAGNMNFAEGGIVAFGNGGDVPRYSSGGMLDAARARARAAQEKLFTYGLRQRQQDPVGFQAAQQELAAARTALQSAEQNYQAEMSASGVNRAAFGAPTAAGPMAAISQTAAKPEPSAAEVQMAMNAGAFKPAAPAAPGPGTGAPSNRPPAPGAVAGQPARVPTGAQDPLIKRLLEDVKSTSVDFTPSTAKPLDAAGILALQRTFEVNPDAVVDPLLERRQALAAAQQAAAEQNLATREKQISEMGVLGADRAARLKAREEKLGKQEKDLGPLSLLQAGLAIMSGSSPRALQNIGIGAQSGLKTYNEGLEKLANARERIDDAFGQLEIARRSERMMTDKELSGLRAGVKSAIIDGQKLFLEGADKAYGIASNKAQVAFTAVVNSAQREADQAAEDRRKLAELTAANAREAQQQAGANVREAAKLTTQRDIARMEAAAKSADVAVRREELRALAADKSVETMRKVWAESKVLQSQYPNINDWLTIVGKGAAGSGTKTDYSKWGTPAKVGP